MTLPCLHVAQHTQELSVTLFCDICRKLFNGSDQWESHVASRKYRKNARAAANRQTNNDPPRVRPDLVPKGLSPPSPHPPSTLTTYTKEQQSDEEQGLPYPLKKAGPIPSHHKPPEARQKSASLRKRRTSRVCFKVADQFHQSQEQACFPRAPSYESQPA